MRINEIQRGFYMPVSDKFPFFGQQFPVPDITVIIPAFCEEETIGEVLQRIIDVSESLGEVEILVVDDGSTDQTSEKVAAFPLVKYLRHERNMGKGAAVRTGIQNSRGKVVVIQDADLEYAPDCIPSLVKPISDGSTDIVYGSRFKNRPEGMSFSHFIGNSMLNLVARFMYNVEITDIMTGQKAFRRSVLDSVELTENGFAVEIEITCLSFNGSRSFIEVPIPYSYRNYGVSKLVYFDGLKSLIKLFSLYVRTAWSNEQKL
jgi:glycosyltransferase involved in cell wall biosynthesis